jgi:putative addiction module killer protein
MQPFPRTVVVYQDARGREPFTDWLGHQEHVVRSVVLRRLGRVADGLLGDVKPVGDGVHELRFNLGAGYRVYLGLDGAVVVVILCAGDKGSQRRDIARAKTCWQDYLEAKR